jgi:curved DNA-binding protein CbpA
MSTEPPDQGSFEVGELPRLLRGWQEAGATGRLDVSVGRLSSALFLGEGRVEAIATDEEKYKLGKWLASRGLIQPDRMALALLKQQEGVPFGRQLVDEGLIAPEVLREELQLRAAALVGLLVFSRGRYRFVAGEKFPPSAVRLDLGTTALLLAAARSSDATRLDELIGSSGALRASEEALEKARDVVLSPHEAYLLSRLEQETTADHVRRLVPLPSAEVDRTLAALVVAGLAELRGQAVVETAALRDVRVEQPEGPARRAPLMSHDQERECAAIRHRAAVGGSWDYYRRLGLSRGATQDQVHERYREMSRMYSAERAAEEPHLADLRAELDAIRGALEEAYGVLTDPHQRKTYDAQLRSGKPPRVEGGAAADDQSGARRELALANLRRARELMRLGEVGEAVQLLEQAVRYDPQPDTMLLLARLELNNPMWRQRALDRLKAALNLDPKFTEAWLELAKFWGRRKDPDRQRECLRRILEYEPGNLAAQEMLSTLGAQRD